MTYKDEGDDELEVVEKGSRNDEEGHGGGEETDGEEECLLTLDETNDEKRFSGRRNEKTVADYCNVSNYPLLVLIWVTSAILFYHLGRWKCKATNDPSLVHSSLPEEPSFHITLSTLQPTLVTDVSALVSKEDELLSGEDKEKKRRRTRMNK